MITALSQSKLRSWVYCPGQFFQQYILGLEPYNPNFDHGTDYHKMVEMYHKRQTTITEPNRDGVEVTYTFNPKMIEKYSEIYPADHYDWPLGDNLEAMKNTTGILKSILPPETMLDLTKPLPLVERKFSVQFKHPQTGQSLPLPFSLVIDGIRLKEPQPALVDLKTSMAAWNQNKADEDTQATVYTYAWWQMTGQLLPFEFVVVRKNPGPRTKPVDVWRTERNIGDFADFWEEAAKLCDEIVTATEYPCYCPLVNGARPHQIKGIN